MKILLYREGEVNAFRMYSKNCDVEMTDDIVYLMEDGAIVEKYEMLNLMETPRLTDGSKNIKEILVKVMVGQRLPIQNNEVVGKLEVLTA